MKEKVRARLEGRLSYFLGVEPSELPSLPIGSICHLLFLLVGDTSEIGGFQTTMGALIKVLGRDVVWEEKKEAEVVEAVKVVIN